ncbi:MAG: ferredoxin [Patescibacteria group bacterium]
MSEEKKKVLKIDEDVCIGCNTCESIAPDYFKIDGGVSKVIKAYDENDAELIQDVIDSCPVQAITVEEETPQE